MSEDEMNAAVAGERPAEPEVCVVLHEGGGAMATVWAVFASEEAARRELGIRVRGTWSPTRMAYWAGASTYILNRETVQP